MGKIVGNRNYGYGKQLSWAGKNALEDRYGQGHFGSKASHQHRWHLFTCYIKQLGIKDARQIDTDTMHRYAMHLKLQVDNGSMKVAYAQNLLSTLNVVLEIMRKDTSLKVSPSDCVGKRSTVRNRPPVTVLPGKTDRSPEITAKAYSGVCSDSVEQTRLTAELCRTFGLRFKEVSLLNATKALRQANRCQRINITEGTKGGHGKGEDRWVPVNEQQLIVLRRVADRQKSQGPQNLIPPDLSYKQWRNQAYSQWRAMTKDIRITGFHYYRAAYVCERYEQLTGFSAPVITGQRQASKSADHQAREVLSKELGHGRTDILVSYIGSAR